MIPLLWHLHTLTVRYRIWRRYRLAIGLTMDGGGLCCHGPVWRTGR